MKRSGAFFGTSVFRRAQRRTRTERSGSVQVAQGAQPFHQVWVQFVSVIGTLVYGGIVSFILLKIIDATIGLRVTEEQETEGLDLALHDERGYIL